MCSEPTALTWVSRERGDGDGEVHGGVHLVDKEHEILEMAILKVLVEWNW